MVRTINVKVNAAHPDFPLLEAAVIVGSPYTAFVRGVPASIGSWHITQVYVQAETPDGATTTVEARVGAEGVYTATLPACNTSGRVKSGFVVLADGIDEQGEPVTGYALGIADLAVYTRDLTVVPGYNGMTMHYFDTAPTVAKKGDVAQFDGLPKLYDGTQWIRFDEEVDLSDYYTKEETDAAIEAVAAYYITSDAQGNAFATHSALVNASTYYSGGVARTLTRNDYAVVLADETHGGAEWRYIYAIADGATVGQWEPQYSIETNDYQQLGNKPSINNVVLNGDKTPAQLGLATKAEITPLQFAAWYPDGSVTSASQFTSGIKYIYDDTNLTAAVRTFYDTGASDNDNSSLTGRVVIPPYVDSNGRRYTVTSIAGVGSGVSANTNLTAVVGPSTLTDLGNNAFSHCTALTSVYLPGATSAGTYAFSGTPALADVRLPKLSSIGYATFMLSGVTAIDFPSVLSVDRDAFYQCGSLKEVNLPNAQTFGYSVFYQCGSLTRVFLPAATSLGYTVFDQCSALVEIDFGNTLTAVPTITSTTFDSANPCNIIVPDALYSEWTTALYWMTLPSKGFRFLKHSEWECARGYTVDDKLAQKQAKITASGILKGDGAGGVSAAVAGTDYQAPLTIDSTPTQSSTNPVQSGGVYTALDGKADKTVPAAAGNIATLTATGGLADGGVDVATTLRYALGTTITASSVMADRTCNSVIAAANNTADILLSFPPATTGKARDFVTLITNTTGNTGDITFVMPSGATVYGDAFTTPCGSGETWLYSFTEVAPNKFFSKAQQAIDPFAPKYWGLYFEAEADNVVVNMTKTGSPSSVSLETSTDGETWTTFDGEGGTTPITLTSKGDRVYFRAGSGGNTAFASSANDYHNFSLSGACGAHGNIMSILNNSNENNVTLSANLCFYHLFYGCTNLTTAPLLPATTITTSCYANMFQGCTALTEAPDLPATTRAPGCYGNMYYNCSSLSRIHIAFTNWGYSGETSNWVSGVASTGTFICPTALGTNETIARDVNRCPANWTVVNI